MEKVRDGNASLAEINLALGNRGTPLHFAAGNPIGNPSELRKLLRVNRTLLKARSLN